MVHRSGRRRRWGDLPQAARGLVERHDTRLVRDDGHVSAQRPGLPDRRPSGQRACCHRERGVRAPVSAGRGADRATRSHGTRYRHALRNRRRRRRCRLHDAARGHAGDDVLPRGAAAARDLLADGPPEHQRGAWPARGRGARCRCSVDAARSDHRLHVRDLRSTRRGDGHARAAHRDALGVLRRARAAPGGRRPLRRRRARGARAADRDWAAHGAGSGPVQHRPPRVPARRHA